MSLLKYFLRANYHPTEMFEKEINRVLDIEECFARGVLERIAWQSMFMAARESGMSEAIATQFIQSKWIRHNEDRIMEKVTDVLFSMMEEDTEYSLNYTNGDGHI